MNAEPETPDVDAATGCADDRLLASAEQVRHAAEAMGVNVSETTRRTKAELLVENARMRAALQYCASGFRFSPTNPGKPDWEGLAREFCRRMEIAGKALQP